MVEYKYVTGYQDFAKHYETSMLLTEVALSPGNLVSTLQS